VLAKLSIDNPCQCKNCRLPTFPDPTALVEDPNDFQALVNSPSQIQSVEDLFVNWWDGEAASDKETAMADSSQSQSNSPSPIPSVDDLLLNWWNGEAAGDKETAIADSSQSQSNSPSPIQSVEDLLANWWDGEATSQTQNVAMASTLLRKNAFCFDSPQRAKNTALVSQVCFCAFFLCLSLPPRIPTIS
jgi:hypothetical protein